MKISISIGGAYYDGEGWDDLASYVETADRLGVDSAWSAEAWGMDAVAMLAYLAARTSRIRLGSGIMQVSARTPAMTAMTALSLAHLSHDRFCLGLGLSGPQVVEGLHGAAFDRPLARLREYVAVVKMALAGERLVFDGEHIQLPRRGGEGKPLRLSMAPKPNLPIYLATLGERSLELTGEIADGWLGACFIPERADALLGPIRLGAERAKRDFSDIEIQVGASLEVSEDVEGLINRYRAGMAFTLGAMGSAKTNFYNAAFSRAGYEESAREVQALWIGGDRKAAIARVPDDMVLAANLIGTEDMVRARLRAYQAAGVDVLRLSPRGESAKQQIEHLEQALDLVSSESERV
jgi:F420-dependent oxidoreductase-like protein